MKRLILSIFLMLIFNQCGKRVTPEHKVEFIPPSRETAEKFVLVDSKGEKKNWVLRAERANSFDDSVKIYNVTVQFYDSKGEYYSTLTSDSGVVYSINGNMSATSNVQVISKDSTVLRTGYLDWNNKNRKIVTEDSVTITKKNSVITGLGMESDPNLEHIVIKKNFKAVSRDVKGE